MLDPSMVVAHWFRISSKGRRRENPPAASAKATQQFDDCEPTMLSIFCYVNMYVSGAKVMHFFYGK